MQQRFNAVIAVLLFASGAAYAASAEHGYANNEPAISGGQTQKFLNNVPDYGNGKPSPNITHSTAAISAANNSPDAVKGPSITSTGAVAGKPGSTIKR